MFPNCHLQRDVDVVNFVLVIYADGEGHADSHDSLHFYYERQLFDGEIRDCCLHLNTDRSNTDVEDTAAAAAAAVRFDDIDHRQDRTRADDLPDLSAANYFFCGFLVDP